MHSLKLKEEFCSALLRVANDFISFPKGEAETRNGQFFPQVVGAIDGSHIPIAAPNEDASDYYNRKQFHSVVLQGVADAQGRFIHVSTGYAGSIYDARVLCMSSLIDEVENGRILVSPVLRTCHGDEIKLLQLLISSQLVYEALSRNCSNNR